MLFPKSKVDLSRVHDDDKRRKPLIVKGGAGNSHAGKGKIDGKNPSKKKNAKNELDRMEKNRTPRGTYTTRSGQGISGHLFLPSVTIGVSFPNIHSRTNH